MTGKFPSQILKLVVRVYAGLQSVAVMTEAELWIRNALGLYGFVGSTGKVCTR